MLTEETQMHREPAVKADKENNWNVTCLIGNRTLFSHRRQIPAV